jgi:glycerol-3-phosphate dehydrogenase
VLADLEEGVYDVLVVGGGINGAVSAACLAARGARVALVERGDFASFTSQQSSNLAWGGIKYMETFELGLVRKLCVSRNHLIRAYPSAVQEIRFYAIHERGFRHGLWKLVLGTWLYWLIGSFFTRPPRRLSRDTIAHEEPVVNLENVDGGFEYSDAYLHDNDARFVWGFVRSAIDQGCAAANYVESLGSSREADGTWTTRARDLVSGRELVVRAKVLVNACGPFVDAMNERTGLETAHRHVLSKGIHLIVDRITKRRRVLTFFADDGRLFFVIPMGPRTCVGTTDTRVDGPHTHVTPEDRRFVLENVSKRLRLETPLREEDVIAERCGVRPLVLRKDKGDGRTKDWTQLSRKHAVEVDREKRHVSIFGGKLTDCLNVGEEVATHVEALGVALPKRDVRWYGEPDAEVRRDFFERAARAKVDELTSPRAAEPLSARLWRRWGADAFAILEAIEADRTKAELLVGGAEHVRAEVEHSARRERIVKLEDFLRRRSKIALVVRREDLRRDPGVREVCSLLFGDDASARFHEYFGEAEELPRTAPPGQAVA